MPEAGMYKNNNTMKNNLRYYLTIVHSELEEMTSDYDQKICDTDDGQPRSVKNSKAEILNDLDSTMSMLMELREKIKTTPLRQLAKEYNLSDD